MIEKGNWSAFKIPKLVQPWRYLEHPPLDRGKFGYDKTGKLDSWSEEAQVAGSIARYNHPKFKDLHYVIKGVLENVIHEKLYPTYYYDRFYFKGQELTRHTDRESCEISISIHISTNAKYKWPLYFEVDGKSHAMTMDPGDAVVYRGMELPHWREPLEGNRDTYYHQIFMHYVRRDGYFVQHAFDCASETT